MKPISVRVLAIKGTTKVFLRQSDYPRHFLLVENGVEHLPNRKYFDNILDTNNTFTYNDNNLVTVGYSNGDLEMTIEEFKSKPQHYDGDSSEEETLRAIANRKELQGYVAIRKPKGSVPIVFEIIGTIEDTGSSFISCTIEEASYAPHAVLYTVEGNNVALDEYESLAEEWKDHAKFQAPKDRTLQFLKINDSYAFSNSGKPFGRSPFRSVHLTLESAKAEEAWLRKEVYTAVTNRLSTEKLSSFKTEQVIARLSTAMCKENPKEIISQVIEDLRKYESMF